jgi:hypothetical protein
VLNAISPPSSTRIRFIAPAFSTHPEPTPVYTPGQDLRSSAIFAIPSPRTFCQHSFTTYLEFSTLLGTLQITHPLSFENSTTNPELSRLVPQSFELYNPHRSATGYLTTIMAAQLANPIYHDPTPAPTRTRRSSSRRSFASSLSRSTSYLEAPRAMCPKDGDAFSYDPAHLRTWYLPQETWDRLPVDLRSSLAAVQHSGAAVLTGKS